MNGKDMLLALSGLNEEIVLDAEEIEAKKRNGKGWKVVAAVAAGILAVTGIGFGIRQVTKAKKSTMTPYKIVPGDDVWDGLGSVEKKVDACRIPDEELSKMNDDELVQAVLDYPFLFDLFAVDDARIGVKWEQENCDALAELIRRGTAGEKLLEKVKELYTDVYVDKIYDDMREQKFDALCLILYYTRECRETLTEEDMEMFSVSVKQTIEMYGGEPV